MIACSIVALVAAAHELLRPGCVALAHRGDALGLRFHALNRSFEVTVFRQSVFAEGASVVVIEGGEERALATDGVASFSAPLDGGRGWAHVTLGDGGELHAALYTLDAGRFRLFRLAPLASLRSHGQHGRSEPAGTLLFYHGTLPSADGAPSKPACGAHAHAHGHRHSVGARRKQPPPEHSRAAAARALSEADGGSAEERAGRMCYCPRQPELLLARIGLIADAGFVSALGGPRRALAEVSHMLQLANALFSEQLGLHVRVGVLRLNADQNGTFAQSGPNYAPAAAEGEPGACPAPVSPGRNAMRAARAGSAGGTARVGVSGAGALLSQLAVWALHHAPYLESETGPGADGQPIAAWHLLTGCSLGQAIGLATVGTACAPEWHAAAVADSGEPCNDECELRLDNGNAARTEVAGTQCSADASLLCLGGHVGLSAFQSSEGLWRTFAHELAHNLDAPHTAAGLMAPYGSAAERPRFFDDGSMCDYIERLSARSDGAAGSCLVAAQRECGNGRLESPEECDDGATDGGDGCAANCTLELRPAVPSAPPPPPKPPGSPAYPAPRAPSALPERFVRSETDEATDPLEVCPARAVPRTVSYGLPGGVLLVMGVALVLAAAAFAAWSCIARKRRGAGGRQPAPAAGRVPVPQRPPSTAPAWQVQPPPRASAPFAVPIADATPVATYPAQVLAVHYNGYHAPRQQAGGGAESSAAWAARPAATPQAMSAVVHT